MAEVVVAYVRCPDCDQRINLFDMKDFESYSMVEVYRHVRARHPKKLGASSTTIPYTPIQFEVTTT